MNRSTLILFSLKSRTNRALFFSSGERIQLMTYKIHNVATLRRELLSFRSRMSFFPLHSLEGNAKLTKAVVYDIGSRSGLGGMSSELEDHIVDYFGPSLGGWPLRRYLLFRIRRSQTYLCRLLFWISVVLHTEPFIARASWSLPVLNR